MDRMISASTKLKNLKKIIFCGIVFLAMNSIVMAQDLVPAIEVQPSAIVEVGEEVFFSATGTTFPDPSILAKARYEWDFGDGYYHRFDPGVSTITRSGISVIHYYMKPGDFTATLKVSVWAEWDKLGNPIGDPLSVQTTTQIIQVKGEEPIAGFEIQRAPFHSRTAQYLYIQIPESHRGGLTTLNVSLKGDKGSNTLLLSKSKLAAEEIVLLNHQPLAQDNYMLIAELFDGLGKRIPGGLWRDKFSKRYPLLPKVGIDENNSFRLNGELFFPIFAFMTDAPKIVNFSEPRTINALHTTGYYPEHSPSTWSLYLDTAKSYDMVAVGPNRGDYFVPSAYFGSAPVNRWNFNHNPDRMAYYVQTSKDKPAMFAWTWKDEPNMGGRAQKTYMPTLAAWSYVSHREDPDHPCYVSFYGLDWTRKYGTGPTENDYLRTAEQFGGKKWIHDAFGFDIYPIAGRLHPGLNFDDMGPYAAYFDAVDRGIANNKNLVPFIPAINPSNRNKDEKILIHHPEQVYAEAWLNIIHGAKAIVWFPYFDSESIRWESMIKFYNQIQILGHAVLQAEPIRTVSDDANTALKRVDVMIREFNGSIYIFAARVTEPEPIDGALYRGVEPETITVNFSVSGLAGDAVAAVIDEGREISLSDGRMTDTFERNAVHIYKISKNLNAPKNARIVE